MIDETAAGRFIYANARLLERHVYAVQFEQANSQTVVDALRPYQNADGGFGHGLEPDKRFPTSQPLDVEIAFERLAVTNASAPALVADACDWLETVADDRGALPILLPPTGHYPRASHWEAQHYPTSLNPTAAIAAHVHAMGLTHPWAVRATEHCLSILESGDVPNEAHTLLGLTKLLAALPDRERATALNATVRAALPSASFMNMDADSQGYGLTPLDFAPTPASLARTWFSDESIQAHLNTLQAAQATDGGWPISWEPLSEAARYEWRTIRTLWALGVLRAYAH